MNHVRIEYEPRRAEANSAGPAADGHRSLLSCLNAAPPPPLPIPPSSPPVIGVIEGNGIGPEIISATLHLAAAIENAIGVRLEIRRGGPVGEAAEAILGTSLPEPVVAFCADIFRAGGAVLSGPGGGRYVYDLRRRFDLFCKFVPVRPWPQLAHAGRIVAAHLQDVDLLIVRDNIGGVYQGTWQEDCNGPDGRVAHHSFSYSERQVSRLIEASLRAAARRRGRLHVIVKDAGVPSISALWRDVALDLARKHSVNTTLMNADLAAYELIQHPAQFDVLVAPNLIGDILADVSGVLVASRGLTFSGNYSPAGHAVYQTNHGCAHDLAGTDTANPAGQMLSLAMLLRESFGLAAAARLIEQALAETWRHGWRTPDIAEPRSRVVGTRAMAEQVAQQVAALAAIPQPA